MTEPELQTSRARDAWAIIRGFVFQVELTIDRWLRLADDEILELERGEDIDTVTRTLASGDFEDHQRLLEQAKFREGNLTLRSAEVVEFLASAAEHCRNNEGRSLRFCLVTTAGTGTENQSPFPERAAALGHWRKMVAEDKPDLAIIAGIGVDPVS